MKHIAAALAVFAPVSAMAHPAGPVAHMHPHGGEIILTLFAVALVGAGAAWKFWR